MSSLQRVLLVLCFLVVAIDGFDTAIELWSDGTEHDAMYQQVLSDLRAVGVTATGAKAVAGLP